jgi:hypothetical protein
VLHPFLGGLPLASIEEGYNASAAQQQNGDEQSRIHQSFLKMKPTLRHDAAPAMGGFFVYTLARWFIREMW